MFEFNGQFPGAILINAEGGTLPYTVAITGTDVFGNIVNETRILPLEGEFIEQGFDEGTYTVTLSDANNNIVSQNVNVECQDRFFRGGYEVLTLKTNTSANNNINQTRSKEKLDLNVAESRNKEVKITQQIIEKDIKSLNNSSVKLGDAPLGLLTYPNPMSDQMFIRYKIKDPDLISIKLMNNIGQVIKVVENQMVREPGIYEISFTRGDLANGIYLGVLTSKNHKYTFKVVIQ